MPCDLERNQRHDLPLTNALNLERNQRHLDGWSVVLERNQRHLDGWSVVREG